MAFSEMAPHTPIAKKLCAFAAGARSASLQGGCFREGIEGDRGVALFERAGRDESAGSQQLAATETAQEVERRLIVGSGLIGWIEEDEIEGGRWNRFGLLFGQALEQRAGASIFNSDTLGDLESREVRAKSVESLRGVLGEPDMGGAAADGLDANCARTRVEIDEPAAFEPRSEDVEEGLAKTVGGGARRCAARSSKLTGAIGTGDNAHLLMVTGAETELLRLRPAFAGGLNPALLQGPSQPISSCRQIEKYQDPGRRIQLGICAGGPFLSAEFSGWRFGSTYSF